MKIEELLSSLPQSLVKGDTVELPDNVIRKILSFAKLKKSDTFYHLGCGNGNAVAIAAKEFQVKRSIGIEIDNKIAGNARQKIAGIKNAEIINLDIRNANISDATVLLFWFTNPELIDTMVARFKKELKDGSRVITLWAPIGMMLPDKVDFPFFICKKPFRHARSIRQQIKAIYHNDCIDFTAAWLLAERYIDSLEVVPSNYRRFVNMLQGMVIWINAWNMGVTCEDEIPPPVTTYIGILREFFSIDLPEMIREHK